MSLSRRRFLAISAAAAALPITARAQFVHHWRGVALGADASITLAHPEAERLVDQARREIARLEQIFSLHKQGSALNRLNATGRLNAPPPELLDCLSHCARLHRATNGMFDPTIQPLWALYARHFAITRNAGLPPRSARAEAMASVGFDRVRLKAGEIRLDPGVALTLNGIAQGYIADRIGALLRAAGLRNVLVNTGEFKALGLAPDGQPWRVGLRAGEKVLARHAALHNSALASSGPRGISFDETGRVGHILNPITGLPAPPYWTLVSVTAPQAWVADGLSTAFCLMDRAAIAEGLGKFPQAMIERLVAV